MANKPVFYIGLNMAGAVSAGAYTAGVMDFLIDALDTWYAERERQKQKFGEDYDRWEIPAHEVRLAVMSGASAGGMTAAISAAALCEAFQPIRRIPAAGMTNRLYRSWVDQIDIKHLLGDRDLAAGANVRSILDSTRINEIAADAVQVSAPLSAPRPYVTDPLRVVLTLTNLRGIPYAIESGNGADETQTLYHADQQDFDVAWSGSTTAGTQAIQLRPGDAGNWPLLGEAAKATGAFPIMLASRILQRTTTEYNRRLWRISNDKPQAGGACQCEIFEALPPNWKAGDGVALRTLNVDGGVTNNSPFECAHRALSQQPPAHPAGHNPRSSVQADRAVINVAPFLSNPTFDLRDNPDAGLLSIAGQLIDTLINQSRIQGENIKLTEDPNVFSRFVIAPSIDDSMLSALASAPLGAFAGFLAREFREHDYQLGRRNCQWFLKRYFGLPMENVVMTEYAPQSPEARARLMDLFRMQLPDGSEGLPLIPILGDLQKEVSIQRATIDRSILGPIADNAVGRLKLVASKLLAEHGGGWLSETALETIWFFAKGEIKNKLLNKMGYELARQQLIE